MRLAFKVLGGQHRLPRREKHQRVPNVVCVYRLAGRFLSSVYRTQKGV